MDKQINLMRNLMLIILIVPVSLNTCGQSIVHPLEDIEKNIKMYKEEWGDTYKDSLYFLDLSLSDYCKQEQMILDMNLNIVQAFINVDIGMLFGYGLTYNSVKRLFKEAKEMPLLKLPSSIKFLELGTMPLPLPFDFSNNKQNLQELIIEEGYNWKQDSLILDFSALDSLKILNLNRLYSYYKKPSINWQFPIVPPPHLRELFIGYYSNHIIPTFPASLKKLYIAIDEYDNQIPLPSHNFPNLQHLEVDNFIPLPNEIVSLSNLKILTINTLREADVEIIAQIPDLDTLCLSIKNEIDTVFPNNLHELVNISVIKITFEYGYQVQRVKTAGIMQKLLPNTTIMFNITVTIGRRKSKTIYVKYDDNKGYNDYY
jgi:hypothetical protein